MSVVGGACRLQLQIVPLVYTTSGNRLVGSKKKWQHPFAWLLPQVSKQRSLHCYSSCGGDLFCQIHCISFQCSKNNFPKMQICSCTSEQWRCYFWPPAQKRTFHVIRAKLNLRLRSFPLSDWLLPNSEFFLLLIQSHFDKFPSFQNLTKQFELKSHSQFSS